MGHQISVLLRMLYEWAFQHTPKLVQNVSRTKQDEDVDNLVFFRTLGYEYLGWEMKIKEVIWSEKDLKIFIPIPYHYRF